MNPFASILGFFTEQRLLFRGRGPEQRSHAEQASGSQERGKSLEDIARIAAEDPTAKNLSEALHRQMQSGRLDNRMLRDADRRIRSIAMESGYSAQELNALSPKTPAQLGQFVRMVLSNSTEVSVPATPERTRVQRGQVVREQQDTSGNWRQTSSESFRQYRGRRRQSENHTRTESPMVHHSEASQKIRDVNNETSVLDYRTGERRYYSNPEPAPSPKPQSPRRKGGFRPRRKPGTNSAFDVSYNTQDRAAIREDQRQADQKKDEEYVQSIREELPKQGAESGEYKNAQERLQWMDETPRDVDTTISAVSTGGLVEMRGGTGTIPGLKAGNVLYIDGKNGRGRALVYKTSSYATILRLERPFSGRVGRGDRVISENMKDALVEKKNTSISRIAGLTSKNMDMYNVPSGKFMLSVQPGGTQLALKLCRQLGVAVEEQDVSGDTLAASIPQPFSAQRMEDLLMQFARAPSLFKHIEPDRRDEQYMRDQEYLASRRQRRNRGNS